MLWSRYTTKFHEHLAATQTSRSRVCQKFQEKGIRLSCCSRLSAFFQGVFEACDIGHDGEHTKHRRCCKAVFDTVIEKRDQWLPVLVAVQEQDRFGVQGDLRSSQHLEKFIQTVCTAGNQHNRVGIHEHHLSALMHVLRNHQRGQFRTALFGTPSDVSVSASSSWTLRNCDPRPFAHQPDIPRAVNKPPAGLRYHRPGVLGGPNMLRIWPGRAPQNTHTERRSGKRLVSLEICRFAA